jgi:hypothetical protein
MTNETGMEFMGGATGLALAQKLRDLHQSWPASKNSKAENLCHYCGQAYPCLTIRTVALRKQKHWTVSRNESARATTGRHSLY